MLPLLGPAFVACIAYVDPGNFATNIAGGAKYGYLLLWVIVAANLMGMLIQNLSAKIGIATGRNLPELCREHFPRGASFGLWVQAELIAMSTDLAEFVGAAIALNLLFGVPLFVAGLDDRRGRVRRPRAADPRLSALRGGDRRVPRVILLGFLYDTLRIGFDARGALGGFVPSFDGSDSVLLATGILGATVMPHVIYLHSALTQKRIKLENDAERRELLRFNRIDVTIAMGLAGIVNMAMLIIAASLFHGSGTERRVDRERARRLQGAGRRRRGARIRDGADGLRLRIVERRHVRRPGRDAGLHRPQDPAASCGG